MTLNEQLEIARRNRGKMEDTVALVQASLAKLGPYDDMMGAFSDELIRCVEKGAPPLFRNAALAALQ